VKKIIDERTLKADENCELKPPSQFASSSPRPDIAFFRTHNEIKNLL